MHELYIQRIYFALVFVFVCVCVCVHKIQLRKSYSMLYLHPHVMCAMENNVANILKRLAFEWNWKVKCKLRVYLHKVSRTQNATSQNIFPHVLLQKMILFFLSFALLLFLSCEHPTTWFTMWNGAEFIRVLCDAQTILIIFSTVFRIVAFTVQLSFIFAILFAQCSVFDYVLFCVKVSNRTPTCR